MAHLTFEQVQRINSSDDLSKVIVNQCNKNPESVSCPIYGSAERAIDYTKVDRYSTSACSLTLPSHLNFREKFLRNIPSGYASTTLTMLTEVVQTVGRHWSTGENKHCIKEGTTSAFTSIEPTSSTSTNCCSDKSPRSTTANRGSQPEAFPKKDKKVGAPSEILVAIDLNTPMNRKYIFSCAPALDFLFDIGFRYEAEKNELIFDTSSLEKKWEEHANNDLRLPNYMAFEACTYLAEIEAAKEWHVKRVSFLNQKLRSKLDQSNTKCGKDATPEQRKERREFLEKSEQAIQKLYDSLDEVVKSGVCYEPMEILNAKCLLRDDRTEHNIQCDIDCNTKHLRRVQKVCETMLNY